MIKRLTFTAIIIFAIAAALTPRGDAAAQGVKADEKEIRKIVLIAGKKSHKPGEHEHEAGVKFFKESFDNATNLKGIKTEAFFNDWPDDPSALDDADTIVIYSDGAESHPLADPARMEKIKALLSQGAGLVLIHWAVHPPPGAENIFQEWVGGIFDPQYSQNPICKVKADIESPAHPISRGCETFSAEDEFYFDIRFKENVENLTPIITAGLPWYKPEKKTLAWAIERKDGGRSFAITGVHFHKNWSIESLRRIVLNAILWTAGLEVPAGGCFPPQPDPHRRELSEKTYSANISVCPDASSLTSNNFSETILRKKQ